MAVFITAFQKTTERQNKEKEKVHRKQAGQIVALEKEKKVLVETVKKQEIEIKKLKGQQNPGKPQSKGEKLTQKDKRQIGRYA